MSLSQMPPLLTYVVTRSLGLALQGAFKSLSKFQMHSGAGKCAWAGNQETCLPIVCLPLACCLPLPPLFSGSISVHRAGLDFKRQWRAWDSRPSSMTSKMCYLKQLTIPKLHFPHSWNINDAGNWANVIYEFVVCSGQGKMQVKRPCGSMFGAHDTISEAKARHVGCLPLITPSFLRRKERTRPARGLAWGCRAVWWQSRDWNQAGTGVT